MAYIGSGHASTNTYREGVGMFDWIFNWMVEIYLAVVAFCIYLFCAAARRNEEVQREIDKMGFPSDPHENGFNKPSEDLKSILDEVERSRGK